MRVALYMCVGGEWSLTQGEPAIEPNLVLAYVSPNAPGAQAAMRALQSRFPKAHVAGCTTGGEILGEKLYTDSIVAAAVQFDKGHVHSARAESTLGRNSFEAGQHIGQALQAPDLRGILVLADGLDTNGSLLVRGLRESLGEDVVIFGGLAADGMDFLATRVACNSDLALGAIAGIGFYGAGLNIRHAGASGWSPVGESARITNSTASIVYEIDYEPALSWVQRVYGLKPRSGLAELAARPIWFSGDNDPQRGVIRSIIGLDDVRGSVTLAGDVRGFLRCRMMQASPHDIIEGTAAAARAVAGFGPNSLALLVSCIGRRITLDTATGSEAMTVATELGSIPQIGFYAYGEISCLTGTPNCDFHNQTMTITVISEDD